MKFYRTTDFINNSIIEEYGVDNNLTSKTIKTFVEGSSTSSSTTSTYVNTCGKRISSTSIDNPDGTRHIVRHSTDLAKSRNMVIKMETVSDRTGDDINFGYVRINDGANVGCTIDYEPGKRLVRKDSVPAVRAFIPVMFPNAPSGCNVEITADSSESNMLVNAKVNLASKGVLDSDINVELKEEYPSFKSFAGRLLNIISRCTRDDGTDEEPRETCISYGKLDDGESFHITYGDNRRVVDGVVKMETNGIRTQYKDVLNFPCPEESITNVEMFTTCVGDTNVMSVKLDEDGDVKIFALIFNNESMHISDDKFVNSADELIGAMLSARRCINITTLIDDSRERMVDITYDNMILDYKKLHALTALDTEFLDYKGVIGNVEALDKRIVEAMDVKFHMNNFKRLGGLYHQAVFCEHASDLSECTKFVMSPNYSDAYKSVYIEAYAAMIAEMCLTDVLGYGTLRNHIENVISMTRR